MEIETDEDGKTVIKSDNINELLAFLKARDKRDVEELRPVLVITMDDPVSNGGYQRPNVGFGQALVASIELSGYRADDACYDDKIADLCCFDFASASDWGEPIIATSPSWVFPTYSFRQLDEVGNHLQQQKRIAGWDSYKNGECMRILRQQVKVLVLASHNLTDQFIAKVLQPWQDVDDENLPLFIHHGPNGGMIIPIERLRHARNRFTAELRFFFNHAKSFCSVAERALFKIHLDADTDKREARVSLPYLDQYYWAWAHPILLQILHMLKDNGCIGTHEHRRMLSQKATPFSFAHLYAEGLPIFETTGEGYDLVWLGTGAFEEWRIHLGKAPRPDEQEPTAYSSHYPHFIFNVFRHIHSTGLLGLDGDRIVLSPWGVRFLELLGPETNDPDVLLRWRHGTEIGTCNDIANMDAWLETAFNAAKICINKELAGEEALFFEDADFLKTGPLSSNRLSVLGIHIPISDSDLDDETFAAEIAKIAQGESHIPIADRYTGLIYDPPKMKTESKLSGLWVGVPLAVNYDGALSQEPGWMKDMSQEYAEALEVIKTAPPMIRKRLSKREPQIIHGIPTKEKRGELRNLSWKHAPTRPDDLRPIIFGAASTINLQDDLPEQLRRRLSLFSNKSGIPEYYDGINHFIGAGKDVVTTTCGYFVGLYDETDGTFIIDREVHPDRIESFGFNKSFMLGNLKAHFKIDRKQDGYWTVLKDGTAKQIVVQLNS